MATVWFSRWPPGSHKIGQIAKIKKSSGCIAQRYPNTKFHWNSPIGYETFLTDDDGRHVIAIAHQMWAKNSGEIYILSVTYTWDKNIVTIDSSGEIALCLDFHVPPPGGQVVNRIGPKLGSVRKNIQ
jgi:hypothetical protein